MNLRGVSYFSPKATALTFAAVSEEDNHCMRPNGRHVQRNESVQQPSVCSSARTSLLVIERLSAITNKLIVFVSNY